MTAESLRLLRDSRGLSRDELAKQLNCSASAIVHWESGSRAIPPWVEEKMLTHTELKFSIKELGELLQMATEENISFDELLTLSIQSTLAKRRAQKAQACKIVQLNEHIDPTKGSIAAEEPKGYG